MTFCSLETFIQSNFKTFFDFHAHACCNNDIFFSWLSFCFRHPVPEIRAKITKVASQITKKINTTVFVHRAIQMFTAREVNKTSIFIYSHGVVEALLF